MCEFQTLHCSNDGYVVRCKECGHYQIGYGSTMLTLGDNDFETLCNVVMHKCAEEDCPSSNNCKRVIIPTVCKSMSILLTYKEALRFNEILQEADNEMKALELMDMFQKI